MRVLVIPSSYPNRYNPLSAPFFRDHARAVRSAGHEVTVIAVVPVSFRTILKSRTLAVGTEHLNDEGVDTYRAVFPAVPKLRRLNNVIRTFVGWQIWKRLNATAQPPDIVHVHGFLAGDLARRISRRCGVAYVVTAHSSAFARGILRSSQRKLAERVFGSATERVAVSREFCRLLSERFGLSFRYIPNPVDHTTTVERLQAPNPSHPEQIRICSVSYLRPEKRIDRLLRAVSLLSEDVNFEVEIAGDGPERRRLETLAHSLGIASRTRFHGALNRAEVFSLLARCDLLAHPSDYETFGVVLVEAMLLGLPVVAAKSGGPESIIHDTQYGLLTEPNDQSFAAGLQSALNTLRRGGYDRGRIAEYARSSYSLEAIGRATTELYARAAAPGT